MQSSGLERPLWPLGVYACTAGGCKTLGQTFFIKYIKIKLWFMNYVCHLNNSFVLIKKQYVCETLYIMCHTMSWYFYNNTSLLCFPAEWFRKCRRTCHHISATRRLVEANNSGAVILIESLVIPHKLLIKKGVLLESGLKVNINRRKSGVAVTHTLQGLFLGTLMLCHQGFIRDPGCMESSSLLECVYSVSFIRLVSWWLSTPPGDEPGVERL